MIVKQYGKLTSACHGGVCEKKTIFAILFVALVAKKLNILALINDLTTLNFNFVVFYHLTGVPGVRPERFEEGLTVKHCALSLVGEPIMYPEINTFLRLLHQQNISSFLVTNAQFPEEIR